jgi:hypothetical protein
LISDDVIAARIALRVKELEVLAAQTACDYWRAARRMLILRLRSGQSATRKLDD